MAIQWMERAKLAQHRLADRIIDWMDAVEARKEAERQSQQAAANSDSE